MIVTVLDTLNQHQNKMPKKKKILYVILKVIAGLSLLYLLMAYCTSHYYEEKNLGKGYGVSIWARDHYIIDWYPSRFSPTFKIIVYQRVCYVEYSRSYIFCKTRNDQTKQTEYWVIKKIRPPQFQKDSLSLSETCTSLIGPLDSSAYNHYKDSLHFVPNPRNTWSIEKP